MSNDQEYVIEKVGVFTPKPEDIEELNSLDKRLNGKIGKIKNITEIKSVKKILSLLKKKSLIA